MDVPHLSPFPDPSDRADLFPADSEAAGHLGLSGERRYLSPLQQRHLGHGFSVTTHPRLLEVHSAFTAFLLRVNWTRVAVVFEEGTVEREQSARLLQDRLLAAGVDCLVRGLGNGSEEVSERAWRGTQSQRRLQGGFEKTFAVAVGG